MRDELKSILLSNLDVAEKEMMRFTYAFEEEAVASLIDELKVKVNTFIFPYKENDDNCVESEQ